MKRVYRFHFLTFFLILLYIGLASYILINQAFEHRISQRLLFSTIGLLITVLIGISARIEIDETFITNRIPILFIKRKKKWGDIHYLVDDYFFKFHFFYLSTSGNVWSLKDTLHTNNLFTNYQDMIREVIYRVPPNCQVDDMFLKKAELTKEDIGKYYCKSGDTVFNK